MGLLCGCFMANGRGLVLIGNSCALLDIHRPDLIDYEKLDKNDHRGNMQLAFDIASKEIGIPDLLDVEDVCDVAKPDERSLMTYIAYWFHAFSQMERVENAGRRVEKFVTNMQGAWGMQNSFEQRMKDLIAEIKAQRRKWEEATFTGSYVDAKEQSTKFARYKTGQKRKWVAEKSDLAALLGNIKTKMGTYRLRPYEPPDDLKLEVLDSEWNTLLRAERDRSQVINETIRDIKNGLRRTFADKANSFALTLHTISLAISGLEGDIDDQLSHVQRLNTNLPPLDAFLSSLSALDNQCSEANIEENDFTTYTYDELAYELGLVKSSVAKKLSFLENQMVARNMTNLTPIQLEEFESVFRHFDRDLSNSLQELEFSAALASLSLVFDEMEMKETFREVSGAKGYVTFGQFIRFMVSVTEDQNTAEQVFQSFREVADGKVCSFPRPCPFPFHPFSQLAPLPPLPLVQSQTNLPSQALCNRSRPPSLPHPRRARRGPPRQHAPPQRAGSARRPPPAEIRLHQLHGEDDGWKRGQRRRQRWRRRGGDGAWGWGEG